MSKITISDILNIANTNDTAGEETEELYLIPLVDILDLFEHSDVIMWLSWSGGLMLIDALDKAKRIREENTDEDELLMELEEGLTSQEKAIIYGALLLSTLDS